jgi:hypothetical protein
MFKTACFLTLLLLTSCAENVLRITEYDASGIPGLPKVAGGCQVSMNGNKVPGRLIYQGTNCSYDSSEE